MNTRNMHKCAFVNGRANVSRLTEMNSHQLCHDFISDFLRLLLATEKGCEGDTERSQSINSFCKTFTPINYVAKSASWVVFQIMRVCVTSSCVAPFLCFLTVIVVACLFQISATDSNTLKRRRTDHHGSWERPLPSPLRVRERHVEVTECITDVHFSPSNYCFVAVNRNKYKIVE